MATRQRFPAMANIRTAFKALHAAHAQRISIEQHVLQEEL